MGQNAFCMCYDCLWHFLFVKETACSKTSVERYEEKKMLQRLTYSNDFFLQVDWGGLLDRKPTDYRCSRGYLKGANSSRLGENFI